MRGTSKQDWPVGYDTELFIKFEEWAICNICHEVLERPTMSGCAAEHMFCYTCIRQHPIYQGCPSCRGTTLNGGRKESVFASRLIQNFSVRCEQAGAGCPWIGPLSNLVGHKNSCEYKPYPCSKSAEGCAFVGTDKQLAEHAQSTCQFANVDCPRSCGITYKRLDEEKHAGVCNAWPCTATERCMTKTTKKFLKQHERQCKIQAAQLKKTKAKLSNVKSELRRKRKTDAKKASKEKEDVAAGGDSDDPGPKMIPTQPEPAGASTPTGSKSAEKQAKGESTASVANASGGGEGDKDAKAGDAESSPQPQQASKKRKRGKKGKGKAKENEAPPANAVAGAASRALSPSPEV
ncbi:hypothetical protein JCM11491_003402 [Sporobolomyces phaffii]